MVQCDYCSCRSSCLKIDCSQCYSDRSFHLCLKCSSNVHLFDQHWKDHSNALYQFEDVPLNENQCSSWLSTDEIHLIETIETCGLGNWIDIGTKLHRKSSSCEKHFEDIYLSPHQSSYSISFQRILSKKLLHGETKVDFTQQKDFQSESIIYPLMLISNDQQKCLTYMPYRDEYERELENNSEYYLPTQIQIDQDETNLLFDEHSQLIDQSKTLLQQSKLTLCRSYSHRIRKRFQLKHFIRDYALAFAFSNDQKFDLHQISRFLSSDQYERLIYNHRKIDQIIDEFGCSSSSSPSTSTRNNSKRTNLRQRSSNSIRSNSIKYRNSKKIRSNISQLKSSTRIKQETNDEEEEEEESLTCQSTLSSTSTEHQNLHLNSPRRRSIRRVSSSSSSSSSMSISDEVSSFCSSRLTKDSSSIDETNRRRSIYPSDHQNSNDKSSRFVHHPSNLFSSSNSSSTSPAEHDSSSNEFNSDENADDESLFISSRTRSHPPSFSPHQTKSSSMKSSLINGENSSKERNGSTNSTKTKRKSKTKSMLTRKKFDEKTRSTKKRKRFLSNSFDE